MPTTIVPATETLFLYYAESAINGTVPVPDNVQHISGVFDELGPIVAWEINNTRAKPIVPGVEMENRGDYPGLFVTNVPSDDFRPHDRLTTVRFFGWGLADSYSVAEYLTNLRRFISLNPP